MPRTNRARSLLLVVLLSGLAGIACEDASESHDIEEVEEALLPAPVVDDLSPEAGPASGGTIVTITGDYFGRGVGVAFGDVPAQVKRVSRTTLRVTTPAHAGGTVDVRVENRNGKSIVLHGAFEYTDGTAPPPAEPDAGTGVDGGSSTPDAAAPPPPPPATSCTLGDSGPIRASADGQIIENLRITSSGGIAVEVDGRKNVVIRNCEILHAGGAGIRFANADGIRIENVRVVHTGAPAAGPNPSDELNNIEGESSTGVVIDHVRVERGSSGVYLMDSPAAQVRFIEGHDVRGPFPRGQLVQFNRCNDATLEDFSMENSPTTSWPEDNVSFFQSGNGTVRRGLIVSNNSPSGVGVMMEAYAGVGQGGLIEDVDTVDMGNGSFSAYPSANVTFRRVRTRDGHCGSQAGRGLPLSNALLFGASPESSNIRLEQAVYYNHCNGNLVWDESSFSVVELVEQSFTARAPQRISFCWSPPPF